LQANLKALLNPGSKPTFTFHIASSAKGSLPRGSPSVQTMSTSALDRALNAGSSRVFLDEEEKATFLRRLRRSLRQGVHQNSVDEFFDCALKMDVEDRHFFFSVQNLEQLVEEHPESTTAVGLLESALCSMIGRDALANGDTKRAVSAFAEAYQKNSLVVRWNFALAPTAQEAFKGVYSDASGATQQRIRAEALFVHANLLFLHGSTKLD